MSITRRPSFKAPEDNHAYLHWPRLFFFNLTGALAIAETGLSSRALRVLTDKKNQVKMTLPGGALHATDVVGVNGAVVASSGFAAILCFVLLNIALFRLHRIETRRSIFIKEVLFGFATVFLLATVIAQTVVVVGRSAKVTSSSLPQAIVNELVAATGQSLRYRDSLAFSAMIVAWLCFGSTCITFLLVSLAARHIVKYGSQPAIGIPHGHHANEKSSNGISHREIAEA